MKRTSVAIMMDYVDEPTVASDDTSTALTGDDESSPYGINCTGGVLHGVLHLPAQAQERERHPRWPELMDR